MVIWEHLGLATRVCCRLTAKSALVALRSAPNSPTIFCFSFCLSFLQACGRRLFPARRYPLLIFNHQVYSHSFLQNTDDKLSFFLALFCLTFQNHSSTASQSHKVVRNANNPRAFSKRPHEAKPKFIPNPKSQFLDSATSENLLTPSVFVLYLNHNHAPPGFLYLTTSSTSTSR